MRQSKVCWHIIGFGSSLVEALLVPRAPAVLRTASKRLAARDAYCKLYQHRVHWIDSYGWATQRVKLKASITSQTKTFNSFLHELRCHKEKLLATVRVESSLTATDIWSPSNWSEHCSRTIRYQKARSISKNRYGTFSRATEASSVVSEAKVPYRWSSYCRAS